MKLALHYALVLVFSVQTLLHPLTHALGVAEAERGVVRESAGGDRHAGNSNPECVGCRTAGTALPMDVSAVTGDSLLVDRVPVSLGGGEGIDRSFSVPARGPPLSLV